MYIKSINLENFIGLKKLGYKFKYSFKETSSNILLWGENGFGKTTILENLHPYPYMLSRDIKKSIIYPAKKEIIFKLSKKDSNEYKSVIEYKSNKETKCYLYINDELLKETEKGNITEYLYQLEHLLIPWEKFKNSCFLKQNALELVETTPAKRYQIISNFIPSLNEYEKAKNYSKEKENILKGILKEKLEEIKNMNLYEERYEKIKEKEKIFNKKALDIYISKINELEDILHKLVLKKATFENEIKNFNELKIGLTNIENELNNIKLNLEQNFKKSFSHNEEYYQEIIIELSNLKNKISNILILIDNLDNTENNYQILKKDLEKIFKSINDINEIENIKNILHKISFLKENILDISSNIKEKNHYIEKNKTYKDLLNKYNIKSEIELYKLFELFNNYKLYNENLDTIGNFIEKNNFLFYSSKEIENFIENKISNIKENINNKLLNININKLVNLIDKYNKNLKFLDKDIFFENFKKYEIPSILECLYNDISFLRKFNENLNFLKNLDLGINLRNLKYLKSDISNIEKIEKENKKLQDLKYEKKKIFETIKKLENSFNHNENDIKCPYCLQHIDIKHIHTLKTNLKDIDSKISNIENKIYKNIKNLKFIELKNINNDWEFVKNRLIYIKNIENEIDNQINKFKNITLFYQKKLRLKLLKKEIVNIWNINIENVIEQLENIKSKLENIKLMNFETNKNRIMKKIKNLQEIKNKYIGNNELMTELEYLLTLKLENFYIVDDLINNIKNIKPIKYNKEKITLNKIEKIKDYIKKNFKEINNIINISNQIKIFYKDNKQINKELLKEIQILIKNNKLDNIKEICLNILKNNEEKENLKQRRKQYIEQINNEKEKIMHQNILVNKLDLKELENKLNNLGKLSNNLLQLNLNIKEEKRKILEKCKTLKIKDLNCSKLNSKEEWLFFAKKLEENINKNKEIIEYIKKKKELKLRKELKQEEIKRIKAQIKTKKIEIEKLEKEYKKSGIFNEINNIEKLEKELKELKEKKENYQQEYNEFLIEKENIETIIKNYIKLKEDIENIENNIFQWNRLKNISDKIQKTLLNIYFTDIINYANKLLKNEGTIKLQLGIKQNNNRYNIYAIDMLTNTEIEDISLLSGAEKSIVQKAISISLAQKAKKINSLWIDEIDASLSEKNKELFIELLNNIENYLNFETVYLISHNSLIKNYCDEIIDLNKLVKVETNE